MRRCSVATLAVSVDALSASTVGLVVSVFHQCGTCNEI